RNCWAVTYITAIARRALRFLGGYASSLPCLPLPLRLRPPLCLFALSLVSGERCAYSSNRTTALSARYGNADAYARSHAPQGSRCTGFPSSFAMASGVVQRRTE